MCGLRRCCSCGGAVDDAQSSRHAESAWPPATPNACSLSWAVARLASRLSCDNPPHDCWPVAALCACASVTLRHAGMLDASLPSDRNVRDTKKRSMPLSAQHTCIDALYHRRCAPLLHPTCAPRNVRTAGLDQATQSSSGWGDLSRVAAVHQVMELSTPAVRLQLD